MQGEFPLALRAVSFPTFLGSEKSVVSLPRFRVVRCLRAGFCRSIKTVQSVLTTEKEVIFFPSGRQCYHSFSLSLLLSFFSFTSHSCPRRAFASCAAFNYLRDGNGNFPSHSSGQTNTEQWARFRCVNFACGLVVIGKGKKLWVMEKNERERDRVSVCV